MSTDFSQMLENLSPAVREQMIALVGDGTKSSSPSTGAESPTDERLEHSDRSDRSDRAYLPEVYQAQRDIAINREPQGYQHLKKLKPLHKKVVAMHLAGNTSAVIAEALNTSAGYVTWILKAPIVQELIAQYDSAQDAEFKRLRYRADDALREALTSDSRTSRLRAAEVFYKREESLDKRNGGTGLTAEDVAKKLLESVNISNSNIQININANSPAPALAEREFTMEPE